MTTNTLINCGSFTVSIGQTTKDVAIISKSSGDFVKLDQTSRSKKLRKVKRTFKNHLCCDQTFCFSWFNDDMTKQLVDILRS
jgi:hypothetical protein